MAKTKEITFQESTIETIDYSLYDFIENKMNLFVNSNKGWKKVPVIWVSAERSFLTKNNPDLRDVNGTLNFPLITIERKGFAKDPTKKGTAWGNIPEINDEKGGSITIAREIKQDKTANFANKDTYKKRNQWTFPRKNKKVVYETYTIPMPVYIDVEYEIKIKTLYQQQMNELVQPFITKTGGINYFLMEREGHQYEGFIQQDFVHDNNISNMDVEERKFETEITINVLGYLIGQGENQEKPKIVKRENAVEVKFPRERIIFGDINEKNENQEYIGVGTGIGGFPIEDESD